MTATRIHTLTLAQFRSFDAARFSFTGETVVLHGPNGVGKTNVLEALSLLAPGRGCRGVPLADMRNRHALAHEPFAVVADITDAMDMQVRIATSGGADNVRAAGDDTARKTDTASSKRTLKIDGRAQAAQGELLDHVSVHWLIPQMDRLFIDPAAERRRFLDRMVADLSPQHHGRLLRFEKLMRERTRLLADGITRGGYDGVWVARLESDMAATAVALNAARMDMVERLSRAIARYHAPDMPFPRPRIALDGTYVPTNAASDADLEDRIAVALRDTRDVDAVRGGSAAGAHRADMIVTHDAKDMPAASCSTGEQKGLLIALTLAFAHLLKAERGHAPILLLDEVVAHLDVTRRSALKELLAAGASQAFLTGTDEALFAPWRAAAQFIHLDAPA